MGHDGSTPDKIYRIAAGDQYGFLYVDLTQSDNTMTKCCTRTEPQSTKRRQSKMESATKNNVHDKNRREGH